MPILKIFLDSGLKEPLFPNKDFLIIFLPKTISSPVNTLETHTNFYLIGKHLLCLP